MAVRRIDGDRWPLLDESRDLELMHRLRRDDASALDDLVKIYWARLLAYADRLLGGPEGADDVVQNALVRIWDRRAAWQPIGPVHSYLYRVVRNLAIDERKWRQVRVRWLTQRRDLERSTAASAAALVEDAELAAALQRAVNALPARRREVFTLARLHDLSYRQTAEIMGISVQTVANQMGAALTELRLALRPFYEGSRPAATRGTPPSLHLGPDRRTEKGGTSRQ